MLNVKRLKKFFSLSLFLSSGRSKQNISKYFDWKRKTTLCTIRANVQPTTVFGVRVAFLLFQYGKRSTEANDLLPPLYVILKWPHGRTEVLYIGKCNQKPSEKDKCIPFGCFWQKGVNSPACFFPLHNYLGDYKKLCPQGSSSVNLQPPFTFYNQTIKLLSTTNINEPKSYLNLEYLLERRD